MWWFWFRFILGLISDDENFNPNFKREKISFDLFCEIVDNVSLIYKEKKLIKELEELEKAKRY